MKRQAMCSDGGDPLGLYLGTTSGEIWRATTRRALAVHRCAPARDLLSLEIAHLHADVGAGAHAGTSR
ncbi:MAG: hypothetical protein R2713_09945 [Ilumatobacteraceae bacterium]